MDRKELITQTKLAFEFLQKLYLEVSYLIREVEGILAQEEEQFIIGRPSGYAITTRSSTGLETVNVQRWLTRSASVFFLPSHLAQSKSGITETPFTDVVVLYLRVILDGKEANEPLVRCGPLFNFKKLSDPKKYPVKFEQVMALIEYNEHKVFHTPSAIQYSDTNISFRGSLLTIPLFDLNNGDELIAKLVKPALDRYRDVAQQAGPVE